MRRLRGGLAAALASLIGISNLMPWLIAPPAFRIDDRNLDGRPDARRWYDASGRLVRLEIDANFDARTDALIEFNAESGEVVRETIDTDRNGTADLLELYAHGALVFAERAALDRPVEDAPVRDGLRPFRDPFGHIAVIRAGTHPHRTVVAVTPSGSIVRRHPRLAAVESGAAPPTARAVHLRSAFVAAARLRGPPAALVL